MRRTNNAANYVIRDGNAWRKERYYEDEYDHERATGSRNYDYSDYDPEDDNDYQGEID